MCDSLRKVNMKRSRNINLLGKYLNKANAFHAYRFNIYKEILRSNRPTALSVVTCTAV